MQILQPKRGINSLKRVLGHCALVSWSAVCLFPIYWVAIASFKDAGAIDRPSTYLPFFNFTPSLEAWRFILFDTNENLIQRVANSLIIGVCSTLATLLLGAIAAYGLTRFSRKLSGLGLMSIMLSTRVLPPVAIALPLYVMAQLTGNLDSLHFLIFVYTAINLPVAIWMMTFVFGTRATAQEESAYLDGATHFHLLFFILVPMVRTAVFTVGLLVFIQCWNEYLFAAYLTSDHALTIPPWMVGQVSIKEAQTGGGSEDVAHLAAATVVMVMPVLVLTIAMQRYLKSLFHGSAANKAV